MFDVNSKIDLNARDVELIKAALETQSKILRLQASAGGAEARTKLDDVKRALAKIDAQGPVARKECKRPTWRGFLRTAT